MKCIFINPHTEEILLLLDKLEPELAEDGLPYIAFIPDITDLDVEFSNLHMEKFQELTEGVLYTTENFTEMLDQIFVEYFDLGYLNYKDKSGSFGEVYINDHSWTKNSFNFWDIIDENDKELLLEIQSHLADLELPQ